MSTPLLDLELPVSREALRTELPVKSEELREIAVIFVNVEGDLTIYFLGQF